ncbi:glycosyltransferase [Seonamhaeicola maritimus]|uniref:Glycosyltransferase n=1 Tax=Seonamhaeicola maritimus TaxID=2591822 RepID=A0A5C7GFE9_9FLAO|nr:glycosyltransferase [Seonamhaeicola maritimus]TXG35336.1 glycosyltransferase [Seonamhaeicola maritimus]
MKLGIIIICYNNENDIDISHCAKYLNKLKDIEICLVNNNSKDNTYNILEEIKEQCVNVSIVDIKRFKSGNSAVKAGARFMSNQFSLKYLGYINTNSLIKYQDLSLLFKAIRDNQVDILNYNQSFLNKKGIRLTMFQSLFPVMDYLAKMNIENHYTNLNHQQ